MAISTPRPDELEAWHCELEAKAPIRNIARRYQIDTARDLFGHTVITLRWGRIGSPGRDRTVSFECARAAQRFVTQVLARRATAPRRIGAGYNKVG